MYQVGDKIVYGEQGACTVEAIGTLSMRGIEKHQQFYTLRPICSGAVIYAPVDSPVFMRPVMTAEEAQALLIRISRIEPIICRETKVNQADAFYKSIFSSHRTEDLAAMLKGLYREERLSARNGSLNLRIERIGKRAREILASELSAALGISYAEADAKLSSIITIGKE